MVTSQLVILFFGLRFPFEQPAHSRPADWEIWLTEHACGVSVCRPMFCVSLMDIRTAVYSLSSALRRTLCSARGTVAKVKVVARKMREIAKILGQRGTVREVRDGEIRIQQINAAVPTPSLAGGATEQNLPRRSAGCDMCLLHCNRNLTGPLSKRRQPAEIKKKKKGKTDVDCELVDEG